MRIVAFIDGCGDRSVGKSLGDRAHADVELAQLRAISIAGLRDDRIGRPFATLCTRVADGSDDG